MKQAICTTKCTSGNPPKFYMVGDKRSYEGDCPKNFKPVVADAAEKPTADDEKKSMTVKSLAKELGVDVQLVKDAAKVTRQDVALTTEQVEAITLAIKTQGRTGNGE